MSKYRRIEINAYRRRVTVVSGAWRSDELFEPAPADTDDVSLNNTSVDEPVEPDSPEGQLILLEAMRSLARRLTPEARLALTAGQVVSAPDTASRWLKLRWFYDFVRLCGGRKVTLVVLSITAALTLVASSPTSAQVYPSWSYTGNLNTGRGGHTATLLPNGKVLVAGGFVEDDFIVVKNSAELYEPATGIWTNTGNLNLGRYGHTATLLPNGKVLVAGGSATHYATNSAELYDPATGMWTETGNLNIARRGQTATLLSNGRVLVAGGEADDIGHNTKTAELYDPATGTWTITGSLHAALAEHTATLLNNGRVLVVGGDDDLSILNTSELYDPDTGTWSVTGNLSGVHSNHSATLLPNGKVLVAAGAGWNTAELYDPSTGTWSTTGNLHAFRDGDRATLLPGGKVLVVGGSYSTPYSSAELYDPATGRWTITAYLPTTRLYHTLTLLPNGKTLVAGGGYSGEITAELYEPNATPGANIIDDPKFIVQQHYNDFLSRDPDAGGLSFWTTAITSCGGDAQCIEVKRINVSAAFYVSIEFQQTGFLIYRLYKTSYGNLPGAPVPIQFSEFLPDTQQIGQGVIVNQAGWETMLENNKQAFFASFVQRPRFTSALPTSMTPDAFVDTLLTNAGVVPSSVDRAAAVGEFGSATTTANNAARARALRRVAENSAFAQQEFNRAFVLMQYFGYLRRNPNDAPEPTLDFQGYNFWLDKLNTANGNFIQAEMVKAFLSSSEYRQRFGQP